MLPLLSQPMYLKLWWFDQIILDLHYVDLRAHWSLFCFNMVSEQEAILELETEERWVVNLTCSFFPSGLTVTEVQILNTLLFSGYLCTYWMLVSKLHMLKNLEEILVRMKENKMKYFYLDLRWFSGWPIGTVQDGLECLKKEDRYLWIMFNS